MRHFNAGKGDSRRQSLTQKEFGNKYDRINWSDTPSDTPGAAPITQVSTEDEQWQQVSRCIP